MKGRTHFREWLLLACMGLAMLATGAAPPATTELEEVDVTSRKEREGERQRERPTGVVPAYEIDVSRAGVTRFEVKLAVPRPQLEIRFRRSSAARQLAPGSARPVQVSGDRVLSTNGKVLYSVPLVLQPDVDEADGLPASITLGPHASLVNTDYLRLLDRQGDTLVELSIAIHPQTRRCEQEMKIVDDGSNFRNRFIVLADSSADCRRVERSREGDLIFADNVPPVLRQAVQQEYETVATRVANRLGRESGLMFVAWWADSPHKGFRLEQSWNRNSLLLFNGAAWQQGLDARQQEELRAAFAAEQIDRRIKQAELPDLFTESAARYLLRMFNAGQAGDRQGWLVDALPGWIADCAVDVANRARVAAARGGVVSIDCGLVTQFVYDAVARAKSPGQNSLYDTWWQLLDQSFRRGRSGATLAEFLASSKEARQIVQGLMDGTVDWNRFVADLDAFGVKLRRDPQASRPAFSIQALTHFDQ